MSRFITLVSRSRRHLIEDAIGVGSLFALLVAMLHLSQL